MRLRHPGLAATLIRRGRTIARKGGRPRPCRNGGRSPDFEGLAGSGDEPDVFRTVCVRGEQALILDLPLDQQLFAALEERSGIHVLATREIPKEMKGQAERPTLVEIEDDEKPGLRVELGASDDEVRQLARGGAARAPRLGDGQEGDAAPDRSASAAFDLLRRLSPRVVDDEAQTRSLAEILVLALGVVGFVFLVVYAVALAWACCSRARSPAASTRSTSAPSACARATSARASRSQSRDQLGELAESFNMMAGGIEDLLRERAEKERLEEELRIARQIQMSLLPASRAVTMPGLRIAALCLPAAEVGGDYYDLLPLSRHAPGRAGGRRLGQGHVGRALHGRAEGPGALALADLRVAGPLLGEANRILAANMDSRSFITMTYAVVDVAARTMRYARAGHNPLIQLEAQLGRDAGARPRRASASASTGASASRRSSRRRRCPWTKGDMFLFFTDGLSEAMNAEAELFGERPAARHPEGDAKASRRGDLKERILAEIRALRGRGRPARRHDPRDPEGGMTARSWHVAWAA